jgi:hypothetical protein
MTLLNCLRRAMSVPMYVHLFILFVFLLRTEREGILVMRCKKQKIWSKGTILITFFEIRNLDLIGRHGWHPVLHLSRYNIDPILKVLKVLWALGAYVIKVTLRIFIIIFLSLSFFNPLYMYLKFLTYSLCKVLGMPRSAQAKLILETK